MTTISGLVVLDKMISIWYRSAIPGFTSAGIIMDITKSILGNASHSTTPSTTSRNVGLRRCPVRWSTIFSVSEPGP